MKKTFIHNLSIFIVFVVIDQISKYLAVGSSTYHLNHGIMLGMLKESSLFLRLTTLASLFSFIFCVYLLLIYILNPKLKIMKYGLSLFVAGIFGNVLDRITLGASVDFIPFSISTLRVAFNLADVFQWIGAIIIIFKLLRYEDLIWYPQNKRDRFILYRREQLKFSAILTVAVVSASLIFGIFTYSFVQAVLISNGLSVYKYMAHFLISYTSLTLIFSLCVFICGLIFSHRTAGPIYSLISHIDAKINGEKVGEFKLRQGDDFKDIEGIAQRLDDYMGK